MTGDPSVTWGREVNTRVRHTGVVQGLGASAEVMPLLLSVCLSFFHISHSQTLFFAACKRVSTPLTAASQKQEKSRSSNGSFWDRQLPLLPRDPSQTNGAHAVLASLSPNP